MGYIISNVIIVLKNWILKLNCPKYLIKFKTLELVTDDVVTVDCSSKYFWMASNAELKRSNRSEIFSAASKSVSFEQGLGSIVELTTLCNKFSTDGESVSLLDNLKLKFTTF